MIIFSVLLVLVTLAIIVDGAVDMLIADLSNGTKHSTGIVEVVFGTVLLPFSLLIFIWFYLPTRNKLIIGTNRITIENYREKRDYDWNVIHSLHVQFIPASGGGSSGDLVSVLLEVADEVANSLQGENDNQSGKVKIEVKTAGEKNKVMFLFLRFKETFPLIDKIVELTNKQPIAEKYKRNWVFTA